jgi:hypothetical protein
MVSAVALLAVFGVVQAADELSAEQRAELAQKAANLNEQAYRKIERGLFEEAVKLFHEALGINKRLYPKDRYPDGHSRISNSLGRLGKALVHRGALA